MSDRSEQARRRNAANRERFAIRREERELEGEERELERELMALEATELDVERATEAEWRHEHWGLDPEAPWSWPPREKPRP